MKRAWVGFLVVFVACGPSSPLVQVPSRDLIPLWSYDSIRDPLTDRVEVEVVYYVRTNDSDGGPLTSVRYGCRSAVGDRSALERLMFWVGRDTRSVEVRFGGDPMQRVGWYLSPILDGEVFHVLIQAMQERSSFILRGVGSSRVFMVPLVEAMFPSWLSASYRVAPETTFVDQYERARRACGLT